MSAVDPTPFARSEGDAGQATVDLPPLHTSRLGLGTWPMERSFGALRRPRDVPALETLLARGSELGMDWIDTAPTYDSGEAEQAVGRFLATLPADLRPAVISKGGIVRDLAGSATRPVSVLRPSVIRGQLDRSLQRLGLEQMPVYLLHYPDETGIPIEESWAVVTDLVREGKVRRAGLCGFPAADLRRCEPVGHVDVVMDLLTPLSDGVAGEVLEFCRSTGTRLITWGCAAPLRLADRAAPGPLAGTPFDTPSERLRVLSASPIGDELMMMTVLSQIATRHSVTLEAAAVAWQLSWDVVEGVIVGADQPRDIESVLVAISLSLTPDELNLVDRVAGWIPVRTAEHAPGAGRPASREPGGLTG